MKQREELKVSPRHTLGKKVKAQRRKGLTPVNLYGPNIESISLEAETSQLERLIISVGRNALVTIRVEDKPRLVMLRDIQRDPLTGSLLHVGLFQIEATHQVKVEVPLALHGEPALVKSRRAMLIQGLTSLHVEGLPTELPRSIEVDLSALEEIGQAIHVRDIPVGDGIAVLNDPDQVVAHLIETRLPAEEEKEGALHETGEEEASV